MNKLTPVQVEDARRIYDGGYTPYRTAEKLRSVYGIEVTHDDVRAVVTLRTNHRARDPEVRAEVRRVRLEERLSYSLIAAKVGVPVTFVEWACRGLKLPEGAKRVSQPRTVGPSRAGNTIRFREPVEVDVPAWVPDRLFEFYEHRARMAGEAVAAIECRKLKHGASLAHL